MQNSYNNSTNRPFFKYVFYIIKYIFSPHQQPEPLPNLQNPDFYENKSDQYQSNKNSYDKVYIGEGNRKVDNQEKEPNLPTIKQSPEIEAFLRSHANPKFVTNQQQLQPEKVENIRNSTQNTTNFNQENNQNEHFHPQQFYQQNQPYRSYQTTQHFQQRGYLPSQQNYDSSNTTEYLNQNIQNYNNPLTTQNHRLRQSAINYSDQSNEQHNYQNHQLRMDQQQPQNFQYEPNQQHFQQQQYYQQQNLSNRNFPTDNLRTESTHNFQHRPEFQHSGNQRVPTDYFHLANAPQRNPPRWTDNIDDENWTIPSGPPPCFTNQNNELRQSRSDKPYSQRRMRTESEGPRGHHRPVESGASELGYLLGGMDFTDHQTNNQYNISYDPADLETDEQRQRRLQVLARRQQDSRHFYEPGHFYGLDYSSEAPALTGEDYHTYQGYAAQQPRRHWKFNPNPEAVPLNTYELPSVDSVNPMRLVGDTLSNQKISYEYPMTEEEKRTFGTSFAPLPGFKPEHKTVN